MTLPSFGGSLAFGDSLAFIPLQDVLSLGVAPDVSVGDLSDTERQVMSHLSMRLGDQVSRGAIELSELYYQGLNAVPSLGISVPPELEPLRAILGWCQAGVDARSERLDIQGFRMPGETTVNSTVQEIWQRNNLDAEAPIIHEQAMSVGYDFGIAGVDDDGSGFPVITTESALRMTAAWDARKREISAAYQRYPDIDPTSPTYGQWLGTLYTRDAIIQLVANAGGWQVQDRNDHQQGFVPVVQFTPRPKFTDRLCGQSLMNAAWRNTQDRACRTLVRMEIAGEFFAAAKIFILGASEEAFLKKDGTKASAWETYLGKISTLEADENGNLPSIVRLAGESPDGFISSLNQERSIMAGHTGLAPEYLGIFSDGNPASADAIRMSDFRLKKIADRLALSFGNDWEALMRMALKVSGEYTPAADQMETDWGYTGIPTPSADTVSISTQIATGMIPATADDALAAVGWSPVERARFAQQRQREQGLATIQQAMAGLKAPPKQAMDGEQPLALQALNSVERTRGAAES